MKTGTASKVSSVCVNDKKNLGGQKSRKTVPLEREGRTLSVTDKGCNQFFFPKLNSRSAQIS